MFPAAKIDFGRTINYALISCAAAGVADPPLEAGRATGGTLIVHNTISYVTTATR